MSREHLERMARAAIELDDRRSVNSFRHFVRRAFEQLEPGKYKHNWHIDLLADVLQERYELWEKGVAGRDILISVPPRSSKSYIVSRLFHPWVWVRNPGVRFIIAGNNHTLALSHSVDARRLIETPWYGRLCKATPWALSSEQNTKDRYDTNHGGYRISKGRGAKITGSGANIIIVDDLNDASDAHSEAGREEAIRYYDTTLYSRLDDPRRDFRIVLQQRIHQDDIYGHICERYGTEVRQINIPAEAEYCTDVDIIPLYQGDTFWVGRFDESVLLKLRRGLGDEAYMAQYNGIPSPPGGAMVKLEWLKYYRGEPSKPDRTYITCDATFGDSKNSDFVGLGVVHIVGPKFYVQSIQQLRLDFVATIAALKEMSELYPMASILVEDKANGPAIISTLRQTLRKVVAFHPRDGKEARVAATLTLWQAGDILLNADDPSREAFKQQLLAFPKVKHDDMVDAVTQVFLQEDGGFQGQGGQGWEEDDLTAKDAEW